MSLQLERPLVFFDIESTGLSIVNDRIVELCYVKVYPDDHTDVYSQRFNPERPISPDAERVHGISQADVASCPTFRQEAPKVFAAMDGCDWAGYNSDNFDAPLLVEEFLRAGISVNTSAIRFIDVQTIYHRFEPRTLSAAYKFYCHKDLENAHSATADTSATYEILLAQLDRYADQLKGDVPSLSAFTQRQDRIDLAGRFVRNDNGLEVFNFGKYRGHSVREVIHSDPGYYSWFMQGEFTRNTKATFQRIWLEEKASHGRK